MADFTLKRSCLDVTIELHPSGVHWGRRSGWSSSSTPNLATKAVFNRAAFCARGALCHAESVKEHNIYTYFFTVQCMFQHPEDPVWRICKGDIDSWWWFPEVSVPRSLITSDWLCSKPASRPPQQQINHYILRRSRTSLHHFFFFPQWETGNICAAARLFQSVEDLWTCLQIIHVSILLQRPDILALNPLQAVSLLARLSLSLGLELKASLPLASFPPVDQQPPLTQHTFLFWLFLSLLAFSFSFCPSPTVRHKDRL